MFLQVVSLSPLHPSCFRASTPAVFRHTDHRNVAKLFYHKSLQIIHDALAEIKITRLGGQSQERSDRRIPAKLVTVLALTVPYSLKNVCYALIRGVEKPDVMAFNSQRPRSTRKFFKGLKRLEFICVLILEDFLMTPVSSDDLANLLEIIEECDQLGPLIISTQYANADWHKLMSVPPSPIPSSTGWFTSQRS